MESNEKSCLKCKIDFDGDNIIGCEGKCFGWYHLHCCNVTEEQYKVISTCKGIRWFCNRCYVESEVSTRACLHEVQENVKQVMKLLKQKDNVALNKNEGNEQKLNYAETVQKQMNQTIIIKPKEGKPAAVDNMIEEIKKKVDPTNLAVGIESFRNIKNTGVAVTCISKEDKEKLQKEVSRKLGNQFNIEEPKKQNYRLKIVGIRNQLSEDNLKKCVEVQNSNLIDQNEFYLKMLFMKKVVKTFTAIIEIDSNTASNILKEQKLKIEWSICKVYLHTNILRCFSCFRYHHKSKDCKDAELCSQCCNKKHADKCSELKCINCAEANEKFNLKLKTNHSVFARDCPVYMRKVEGLTNRLYLNKPSDK